MRITKEQLTQIIKEEIRLVLEGYAGPAAKSAAKYANKNRIKVSRGHSFYHDGFDDAMANLKASDVHSGKDQDAYNRGYDEGIRTKEDLEKLGSRNENLEKKDIKEQ